MEEATGRQDGAKALGSAVDIITHHTGRALRLADTGRADQARAQADLALRRATMLGDGQALAMALLASGAAHDVANDYVHACVDYRAALRHAEDAGDQVLEARASAYLGTALLPLGLPNRAIPRLAWAVHVARAADDVESEIRAYLGLSRVYARLEVLDRAEAFATRALELAEARGDDSLLVTALRVMGNVRGTEMFCRAEMGQPDDGAAAAALGWYERARRLAAKLGDRVGELWLVNNIAEIHRGRDEPREVVRITEEAVDFAEEMPPVIRALLVGRLGVARLRLGDHDKALTLLLEALDLVGRTLNREHSPVIHEALAEVYEKRGEIAKALEHHKAYHQGTLLLRADTPIGDALEVAAQLEKDALTVESERRRRENDSLNLELRDLRERTDGLDHPARRDALTGLPNRMAFDEWLARECRSTVPLTSVALIDVDRFKLVNDRYSHQVGDRVLSEVGRLLASSVRQGDLVARYGGEEFGLVLPGTSLSDAVAVCERARERVREADWSAIADGLTITLSAGVAQDSSSDRVLVIADERLYAAKRAGRDRVVAEDINDIGDIAVSG